jgi:glutamate--cysteine ligase
LGPKEGAVTGPVGGTPGAILAHVEDAARHIGGVCFKKGPPTLIGAELEWLVSDLHDRHATVPLSAVQDHLASLELTGRSSLTFEPGGQLELSSAVFDRPDLLCDSLRDDLDAVTHRLSTHNVALSDRAFDATRPSVRQLTSPRYEAMADYFATTSPELGPLMMCRCVGLQINLDAGIDDADIVRRWHLLHALGPTLTAAFANSPADGWLSRRQSVWQQLDPSRTAIPVGADPVEAWTRYALDAPVMMVREGEHWLSRPGFTFAEWIEGAPGVRRPTTDDLDYHLTTLFPPVRPRGWFELRYLDAQPREWWPVPVLVVWALLQDPGATTESLAFCDPTPARWENAARDGLHDAELATCAKATFESALATLDGSGIDPSYVALVANYSERFVQRGLTPADERIYA